MRIAPHRMPASLYILHASSSLNVRSSCYLRHMKPISSRQWLGTPKSAHATRVLMLGSGELGKEVVIELQRFVVEVIACDRYADAPAMQVAHRSHVIDMLDRAQLRRVVEQERPHLIVPEIEAIATQELLALEAE